MPVRHFLSLEDCSPEELQAIIERAVDMKAKRAEIAKQEPFKNLVMAMIFEKSSTRTRASFETGMVQLGGHALFLSSRDTQLGRGEPIADSAKVLSSMVDILMVRTFGHERIEELAANSSVPVINGLTDTFHPCQLLADMQTYYEHRGLIAGKKVAWIGDGNNMCHSYMVAAKQFGFHLAIACPEGYLPDAALIEQYQDYISISQSPETAAKDADLLATDVWASMGQKAEQQKRVQAFKGYQINPELLAHAHSDALFMHCLPAHEGEEISEGLLNHPQSVVWDEAENRLHAQKALVEFLLLQAQQA